MLINFIISSSYNYANFVHGPFLTGADANHLQKYKIIVFTSYKEYFNINILEVLFKIRWGSFTKLIVINNK